jgi:hypothetical protein
MARKNNTTKREIDMGAYVYKLSGIRNYLELNIEGKQELVYQIEYWFKPSYGFNSQFGFQSEGCRPKTYKQTVAAIKRAFTDRPVRFISYAGYENVFKVTHDDFTDVLDNQLGEDCYPLVDQSLIK